MLEVEESTNANEEDQETGQDTDQDKSPIFRVLDTEI